MTWYKLPNRNTLKVTTKTEANLFVSEVLSAVTDHVAQAAQSQHSQSDKKLKGNLFFSVVFSAVTGHVAQAAQWQPADDGHQHVGQGRADHPTLWK